MGQPKRAERGLSPGVCPLTTTVSVIASKWAAAIWYQLSTSGAGGRRARRSEELRHAIPGITRKMLVEQLRQFEADGLVERNIRRTNPPQVSYLLTDHGRDLSPVWDAMWKWGTVHLERQTGLVRRARIPPEGDGGH